MKDMGSGVTRYSINSRKMVYIPDRDSCYMEAALDMQSNLKQWE
jgi:hypothetical protein